MMIPIPKRLIRIAANVGIVVCSAWTITYVCSGEYKDAGIFAFFTAANVVTLIMHRRTK